MFDSILVVCEANMCRSPMAQAILARRLRDSTIVSAGTRAMPGRMVDVTTSKLMAIHGYDLRGHVASLVDLPKVRAAQLILTMTMVLMTSMALTRERERGTYENLLAMPTRPLEIMIGKIAPNILVGFVQAALVLLAAKVIFAVPMIGSLALLSGVLVIFIAANLAVGYTFSTVAET